MSTRSNIIRENLDGSFDEIYSHWDGYPSHHGPILLENYSTPEKVQALLDLGGISVLGETIGEQHDFDNAPDGQCNAFGRDRGESGMEAKHFQDRASLDRMLSESWTEWVYVYRVADDKWYYMNNPSPTWFKCCGTNQLPLQPLTAEVCVEG